MKVYLDILGTEFSLSLISAKSLTVTRRDAFAMPAFQSVVSGEMQKRKSEEDQTSRKRFAFDSGSTSSNADHRPLAENINAAQGGERYWMVQW